MASGKSHARSTSGVIITVVSAITTVILVANVPQVQTFVTSNTAGLFVFVTGLIVGHYATPDVRDQQKKTNHGEKMVGDHYGKVAGALWSTLWEPLAKRIPHRDWASHLPGVATLIAAVWLYWLPITVLWWYGYMVPVDLMLWHLAGWTIQDTVHLAQDNWRIRW